MGSGHRGVRLELDISSTAMKRRKHFAKRSDASNVGWRPESVETYKIALDECLEDLVVADKLQWLSKSIDERLAELEKSIIQTTTLCKKVVNIIDESKAAETEALRGLLTLRRNLAEGSITRHETRKSRSVSGKDCGRKSIISLRSDSRSSGG